MLTDIIGSTELAAELGDERWKQVLATITVSFEKP
jgi:hypothetical protein